MSNEAIAALDPNGLFPEPDRAAYIIIESPDGSTTRPVGFGAPLFEPISAYVAQAVLHNSSELNFIIIQNVREASDEFDIIDWNPDKRELKVKVKDGAFGT